MVQNKKDRINWCKHNIDKNLNDVMFSYKLIFYLKASEGMR